MCNFCLLYHEIVKALFNNGEEKSTLIINERNKDYSLINYFSHSVSHIPNLWNFGNAKQGKKIRIKIPDI